MFLGSGDIQLGVNESLYDTSRVVSSMVDGIMARVGHHSEVEVGRQLLVGSLPLSLTPISPVPPSQTLAANSSVPVINALSHLYHPTQILADLQTLLEVRAPYSPELSSLKGLTVAWVGDSNNILNEMIVTYPRLGINLQIATPEGYPLDKEVVERAEKALKTEGGEGKIIHTHSPEEAVKGAHVITTDTWCVAPLPFLPMLSLTLGAAGSPWARRTRPPSASRISPATKLPTTCSAVEEPSRTRSSCTASPATSTRWMMRSSTDPTRSSSRRLRTGELVLVASVMVPGGTVEPSRGVEREER